MINPIRYNWTPSEPLSIVKAAWIGTMQVLDEAKTPREYERKLINVINDHVLSHVDQGTTISVGIRIILTYQICATSICK